MHKIVILSLNSAKVVDFSPKWMYIFRQEEAVAPILPPAMMPVLLLCLFRYSSVWPSTIFQLVLFVYHFADLCTITLSPQPASQDFPVLSLSYPYLLI